MIYFESLITGLLHGVGFIVGAAFALYTLLSLLGVFE